jgi:hypothetical protein
MSSVTSQSFLRVSPEFCPTTDAYGFDARCFQKVFREIGIKSGGLIAISQLEDSSL